jgi:hypothetical protein
MSMDNEWELFRTFPERGPAEAMRSWLEHEEIPCMIEARALENAREGQFCLFVAKKLAHRARWVVAQLPPTDAELDFLATGKLPGQEEK